MRSESATKVSCLFIVILSQAITVTCQNETIPTTSPEGFESTILPYPGTKPSASQPQATLISTDNTVIAEVSIVGSSADKFRQAPKSHPSTQALKSTLTTTTRTTTISTPTASLVDVHLAGSHTGYSEAQVDERLQNEKTLTPALIKTSHPVVKSSSFEEMASWKATKDIQQMEIPTRKSTPSTSSSIKGVMRSSEVFKIVASLPNKQETTSAGLSSQEKKILFSQTKEDLTSSLFMEIESSFVPEQIFSSETKEKKTSSKALEINASPIIMEQEKGSSLSAKPVMSTSSPIKRTLSSQSTEKMISSKVLEIEPSPIITEKLETSSLFTKPAPSEESVSSSKQTATPQPTKMMESSGTLITQVFGTSIVPKHPSQQLEDMTSLSLTKLMTSSPLLTSSEVLRSTSGITSTEPKHLEDMTSLHPKNTMPSSPMGSPWQIMEAMSSSQVNKEITLSLSQNSSLEKTKTSSLITNIVTSSKSIKDLTSSHTLISTPFKEVNIVISALILSSSQIADLITSSHPMTMKAVTSSAAESTEEKEPSTTETTEPSVKEKTTTTTKPLTTPEAPTAKTTTPSEMNTSGKKSVTMTTSHYTHPPVHPSEPTHHTKPIHPGDGTHHGDKNTTNKTHDGHVVDRGPHSTMGYPDEPPVVEASTDEKDDSNWQISVYVVCALLIGIVSFVVVMVVKSNRELKRRASLRERKRQRRPVTRKDNNAHALKMIKTEEPKSTHGAEKKEKRLSMHSRAGTEESIPLLQLHIGDGEHPVLSKQNEEQETQPDQPSTSYKDSKPLIEENGNTVDVPFI